MGVAYKDGISVVHMTLNSISKKAYHVFVGECVVYKTLNYEICLNAKTLNSKIFGIFWKLGLTTFLVDKVLPIRP